MTETPVTAIPNVGPKTAAAFARAGITTAEAVRSLGADAAYARLIATGTQPHFIGYYALVLGLQGRPWNDLRGPEKAALRARFDGLVAESRLPGDGMSPDLARALDALGVAVRPPRRA